MYQLIKFKEPIPSCEIHELRFNENNWEYVYAINTPFELTKQNTKELIIYKHISDLYLRLPDSVHPESVNLKVKNIDEYLNWLDKQKEADNEYRNSWKQKNPDAIINSIKLQNKNYLYEDLMRLKISYIASVIQKNNSDTEFAAI